MVRITHEPIDIGQIIREISTPRTGGTDVFVGTVRNHSHGKRVHQLEYSAYVPMAEKVMNEIEHDLRTRWVLERVALVHRVGMLQVGDVAVVTAVSAGHRDTAFEACRYAIDRVKSIAPIWKKEYFEEGVSWVVGQHEVDISNPQS